MINSNKKENVEYFHKLYSMNEKILRLVQMRNTAISRKLRLVTHQQLSNSPDYFVLRF